MIRRLLSALATTLALLVGGLLLAPYAAAQAPEATGWWSFASHSGQNAPPPPDVNDGDLLVQGGDLGGAAPSLGLPTSPSAVAAVRFAIPDGAEVGALTLQVGGNARATDLRAYPVKKDDWKPSDGGPLADAPVAAGSRYSTGVLSADGTQLSFRDIARLVRPDGRLSVVLMPGASDRVVVKKPTAAALAVTEPDSGTYAAPPPGQDASGAAPVTPVSGVGTAPLPPLETGSVPSAADPVAPPAETAPMVAGSATAPAPAAAAPVSASPQDLTSARVAADQRTRYLVALEALLVLATFGLIGWGPLRGLAALTGQPPLAEVQASRGVGRFVSERTGEVIRL